LRTTATIDALEISFETLDSYFSKASSNSMNISF